MKLPQLSLRNISWWAYRAFASAMLLLFAVAAAETILVILGTIWLFIYSMFFQSSGGAR